MSQEDLARKNELELVSIRGELNLVSQKIDSLKTNDLLHLQKSIITLHKVLWGVAIVVFGELMMAIRMAIWG